nr:glycosyl hydrolase-related protein [Armatimonadota bacterium]
VQQGWNLNTPLEATAVTAHGGPLAVSGSFLNVSGKGIVMTALKQAEDGNGMVVRFYNVTDFDTDASVQFSFPRPVRSVHLADMKETEGKPVPIRRQMVHLPVGHSSTVTLRLRF